MTIAELNTILIEIEGTLNNRPLTFAYEELGEEMLTPAHMLYGYRYDVIPDDVKDDEDETSLDKRYRYLANRRRHFWRRWKTEYLVDLREHHRLQVKKSGREIKEGDVVIVVDKNKLPRGRWKLGHIIKLITGSDGVVRGAKVDVIVKDNRHYELDRPIQKLVPLEVALQVDSKTNDIEVTRRSLPRRAAAVDADWRRQLLDQLD